MQQKWLSKLLDYDFIVEYKRGPENRVTDALSRQKKEEISLALISIPSLDWLEEIKKGYEADQELVN